MALTERLRDEGAAKWLAIAAVIISLEYVGDESLTHAVHRGLETRIGKVAIPVAIAVTAAHFYDVIPHKYDPYYILGGGMSKSKNVGEHGEEQGC